MKYVVTINDNQYEVEVEEREAQVAFIGKVPAAQAAPVAAPVAEASKPQAAPVQAMAGEKILAPMPGVILDIKKKSGDTVKKGETIMMLEAMKMENEIIASKDGVIAQIATAKGASVETGTLLAVLQ
jgi:glutaconyl-CoA/methylmalonyl-CoA decarboxylase subunit gamma